VLHLDIDPRALGMTVPSGVLLSLAQALFSAPATDADSRSLEVRATARGVAGGVYLTVTATTSATCVDLQSMAARVAQRLALTCGGSPTVELEQEGTRRLTLHTVLINQERTNHEQVPGH
jgi:hypothetical protein